MSEYAITPCPRHFGTHRAIIDLNVMMTRIGPREYIRAFNDMTECMRRVLPFTLNADEYEGMDYQPQARSDPKLIEALKTWDGGEVEDDENVELIFNTEAMRLLLRQLCLAIFIGPGASSGPDALFNQFCHTNIIYPGERPYMVAGGLERDNDAPNDSYDAIMMLDATGAFTQSFTEDEIARITGVTR